MVVVFVGVDVVFVAGRETGVVGVARRRGGVVAAGLAAGLVDGRLVLPPIMPPPVTPPGSCCASATLLVVSINRTADRQITRGDERDMTFSPAVNPNERRTPRWAL